MSILKMMFAKHAPTHHAEVWRPAHDGALNLVEARRGRGKSFGATWIMLQWFLERWEAIESGANKYAKVLSNIKFDHQHVLYALKRLGIRTHSDDILDILQERLVYITKWDEVLTSYDSLIMIDEANRNLDVYDTGKENHLIMRVIHDWLQQTRKHKLTLWFFVQDVDWIKQQVRSLMDKLWRAKRVRVKGTMKVRYFPWYGSDPWAQGKGRELNRSADFKMKFDFDMWIARCYDTLQAVETLEQQSNFKSFGDISKYMLENGLKPGKIQQEKKFMTYREELAYWDAVSRGVSPLPPPSGYAATGGWGGVARLGAAHEAAPLVGAAAAYEPAPPLSTPVKKKRVHRVKASA